MGQRRTFFGHIIGGRCNWSIYVIQVCVNLSTKQHKQNTNMHKIIANIISRDL